jgi:hypothetical protein
VPRRALTAAVAALFLTIPDAALGDDLPTEHVIVESPNVTIVVPKDDGPRIFGLPIGSHVLTPPSWQRLDEAYRKLEEDRTRITAENDSFRKTMQSWTPGWKIVLSTLIVGIAGGVYVGTRF